MNADGLPTVLFVAHATSVYGGASLSLCNMLASLRGRVDAIVVSCERGQVIDRIQQMGIECHHVPFPLIWEYKKDLRYYLRLPSLLWHHLVRQRRLARDLARRLSGRHIDLVHSNSSAFTFGVSMARTLGCPHVWHVREFLDLDFNYSIVLGRPHLRRMISHAAARIAISSAVARHWRMPAQHTHIIGNAVRRASQAVIVPDKEDYVMFCAATLSEMKGASFCIRAFALSGLSGQGLRLLMFGRSTPEYRASLMQTATECGVAASVEIRDFCQDIDRYLQHAVAFVMASEHEALGRVTIEAMFNGCPVVARSTDGSLDIVSDGRTGLLFSDLDGCAAALRRIVDDPHATSLMVRRAQTDAIEKFSEDRYADHILSVYRQVLFCKPD